MQGKTQEAAAAAAGMSVRSARKWETGPLPSQGKAPREWRTRKDPFEEVWASEVVPLLEADEEGRLQAKTLLEELQRGDPDKFSEGQLRTLQRRVRDWRALHGPGKEVYFEQHHPPGREAAMDFTHGTELGVTIAGVLFAHLLFAFRLSYSGWVWVQLAFGETFEALLGGLQGALWELGGAPDSGRTDNLSAATHELKKGGGRQFNERWRQALAHYGMTPTRIAPGKSHENGGVEKSHDLLKTRLEQALLLRGHRDFDSEQSYMAFVQQQVAALNGRRAARLAEERAALRPLPAAALPAYTTFAPTVRKWSTIRVSGRTYSVPSRLIGHELEVRQHADVLQVFYKGSLVETMPRLRAESAARIDYRHIIWSLVRKPGAFLRWRYQEELFPTLAFRRAYDALQASHGERAHIEYVRILHLAASTMECTVDQALSELLQRGSTFDYAAVKALAQPEQRAVPDLRLPTPNLRDYDDLLEGDHGRAAAQHG